MPEYRKERQPVEHKATKWDGFTLVKTEHEYKCQKGSGRSIILGELAEDGMKVRDWTKRCAERGFDAQFCVGSVLKLMTTKAPGWVLSQTDENGRSIEEVRKMRDEDPEVTAERERKKAEKEAEKERKRAEREQKKAEKAREREEAKRKKAEEKEAEAKAKAEAEAESGEQAKPKKGKAKKEQAEAA